MIELGSKATERCIDCGRRKLSITATGSCQCESCQDALFNRLRKVAGKREVKHSKKSRVLKMYSEGMTVLEILEITNYNEVLIRRYINDFEKGRVTCQIG